MLSIFASRPSKKLTIKAKIPPKRALTETKCQKRDREIKLEYFAKFSLIAEGIYWISIQSKRSRKRAYCCCKKEIFIFNQRKIDVQKQQTFQAMRLPKWHRSFLYFKSSLQSARLLQSDLIIRKREMKSKKVQFPDLASFKELYAQIYRFLYEIKEENIEDTHKLIKRSFKNYSIFDQVLEKFQDTMKYKKGYKSQREKNKEIEEKLVTVRKENIQLRKRQNAKYELPKSSQLSFIKLQTISLLEDGFLLEAKQMAIKQKLPNLEHIVQLLWEYKWIAFHLGMNFELGAFDCGFKQSGFSFSLKREQLKRLVEESNAMKNMINQKIELILKTILDPQSQPIFQSSFLSEGVKRFLKAIDCQLQYFRNHDGEISQQIAKIKRIINKHHAVTEPFKEDHSFFQTLSFILETQLTHLQSESTLTNSKSSKQNAVLKQFDDKSCEDEVLQYKLNTIKSCEGQFLSKTKEEKPNKLEKKVMELGKRLKQFGYFQKNSEEPSDGLKIIARAIDLVQKREVYKDTMQVIIDQENQIIQLLKNMNNSLLNTFTFTNPKVISTQKELKPVFQLFQSNFNTLIDKMKDQGCLYLTPPSSGQQKIHQIFSSKKQSDSLYLAKQQIANRHSYEEQDLKYLESMEMKTREELLEVIIQLRDEISSIKNQRVKNDQNSRLLQLKIRSLNQSLAASCILQVQENEIPGETQIQIDELRLENMNLKKQLTKREEELTQLKANSLRLVEETNIELAAQIKKSKEQYQKINQILKKTVVEYNDKLEKKQVQMERKALQLKNSEHMFLQIAESKIKQISAEKSKLLRTNESLRLQNQRLSKIVQKEKKKQEKTSQSFGSNQIFLNESKSISTNSFETENLVETPNTIESFQQIKHFQELKMPFSQKGEEQASIRNKLKESNEELEKLNELVVNQKKIIENKNIICQASTKKIQALQAELNQLNKQLEEQKSLIVADKSKSAKTDQLFVLGSIFSQPAMEERMYLIETLTSFLGPIKRTHLLYRFDSINKANPHRYIDKHKNIVLIAKTIYGKYIAAYSKEMIDSAGCKEGFGLLMGLWNQTAFEIQPSKKSVSYDDFYIIFGNSQFRIKSQETKIFSNFGINNGYFNSRGCKVDSLLGEGTDRQVNIEGYEVYQLQLERKF